MVELYMMAFLLLIIALFVTLIAVTGYMVMVVLRHDLDERRKEVEDADNEDL